MLTPEQIAYLRDAADKVSHPMTDYLISEIARRISEAGQLTSTAAYEIWRVQSLGMSQREIKNQLKALLEKSNSEIERLLRQSAEVGYSFDISKLPTASAIPFEQNAVLQQTVAAAVKLAQDDLTNMVQTIGFIAPDGKAYPLTKAYKKACDFAFQQTFTGAADYTTAIRNACKTLAGLGIRTINYDSGVSTSLEAAVRRSVMGGLGLMQEQITRQNHDDMGADGWEISAHANSAPDHEPIQGKQYSDAAYTALNDSLVRRIGTLNCGHAAFPVIIGVSQPQYTEAELRKFREDNAAGIDYQGRHYTGYEATQMQRKVERTIRAQRRRVLVDEARGDKERLQTDQIRLRRLDEEYKRFSKAANLRTQQERLEVSGFGPKQAVVAQRTAQAELDKYKEIRYNKDGTIQVTDNWTAKPHPRLAPEYEPNAVVDTVSRGGKQRDRMIYDAEGRQIKQISNGPHGNLKQHPFGAHGEHAHDIIWENGEIVGRPKREITDQERKENADIL